MNSLRSLNGDGLVNHYLMCLVENSKPTPPITTQKQLSQARFAATANKYRQPLTNLRKVIKLYTLQPEKRLLYFPNSQ
jgi:hypothetical protein